MYDIITIGTATQDVFIKSPLFTTVHDPKHLKQHGFLDGIATCFTPGAKVEIDAPVFATGGGASNTATTFARMGLRTGIISNIGADESGERILAECKRERITSHIAIDHKHSTAYSSILVPPEGERTILTHRGASDKLTPSDIDHVTTQSRWVYIVPGNIPYTTVLHAIKRFKQRGSFIALNPSHHIVAKGLRTLKPLLAHIDVLILNREEAALLTGVAYNDIRTILTTLHMAYSGIIAVTDGPAGAFVIDHAHQYTCGVFSKRTLSDATGAGDAYGSGLVSGLIHAQKTTKSLVFSEAAIHEAIRIAAANSASVVEHVGAKRGILTRSQLGNPRWKKLSIKSSTI